ncbi:MAG: Y-family DNA polymerase [Muribaculaceae bacterium]|nr:Y-family DNA polymerase [Muribaculaceae bacterium]
MIMIGLVDCNNFFVSCERLFNPSLEGKAVVVLSNNDGCVISRSNEAKVLGIPMGVPAFKIKEYTNPLNVVTLSCRHVIYRDISDRVMALIGNYVESIQIYSVDECFFKLPYEDDERNYKFVRELASTIKRYTGIPVSIGVAPSRTLAKIASHIAKKTRNGIDNVYLLTREEQFEPVLKTIPVGDVWGIGRRLNEKLLRNRVLTAYDLSISPMSWIKCMFTINEERIVRELKGEDCAKINAIDEPNKSIMASRSFGTLIEDKKTLWEAVAYFASCCAERLRAQNSAAMVVSVYVRGDEHKEREPFYSNTCDIRLETPSCDTAYITQHALRAFNNIYRKGYKYKKAGVQLSHFVQNGEIQLNVFDNVDVDKQKRLMSVLDKINGVCGKGTLILGAQGVDKKWSPRKDHTAKQSSVLRIYSGMSFLDLGNKK